MSDISGHTIAVLDAKGAAVSKIKPELLESLGYISGQTGLAYGILLEAAVTLFIACTSATLGPSGFLPDPGAGDS